MESSAASFSSSSSSSSSGAASGAVDSSPLLSGAGSGRDDDWNRRFGRQAGLRGAARLLRRAGSRRASMREPSIRVRETAAEQLEEAQSDWAYSRPVVVLDIVWNLAFVGAAAVVMVLSRSEAPSMPLRLWIAGYAMQCLLHMVCVRFEYRRRQELQRAAPVERVGGGVGEGLVVEVQPEGGGGGFGAQQMGQEDRTSVAKHLESANTMFSFIWWIIGFYWVSAGSKTLPYESPLLYWLCIVFLAFDVFFVVFCVALACLIGIAVCCCLPCIIAILYAVADQDGATEEDICQLPRYKFHRYNNIEKGNGEVSEPFGGIMTECGTETPMEHVLSAEDAECCICLSAYEDGVELRELPCCHHFHCACVDKWLYINSTCPLCKFNIVKSIAHDREEV